MVPLQGRGHRGEGDWKREFLRPAERRARKRKRGVRERKRRASKRKRKR
jgi:hypothetical protein